ncbi:hypothetical protein ACQ4M3_19160 [Leptolyngbya sp. AN03gr2]|uniref:hypothetical protein n=1 Tax=Leptolyngbya sp. AN03gr2 TaxID=3423364 RepID=UPI003D31BF61
MKALVLSFVATGLFASAAQAHGDKKYTPEPVAPVQPTLNVKPSAESDATATAKSQAEAAAVSGSQSSVGNVGASSLGIQNLSVTHRSSMQWLNNNVARPTLSIGVGIVGDEIQGQVGLAIPLGRTSDRLSDVSRIAAIAKDCPAINAMTFTGVVSPDVQKVREFCKNIAAPVVPAPVVQYIPVPSLPALPSGSGEPAVEKPAPVVEDEPEEQKPGTPVRGLW